MSPFSSRRVFPHVSLPPASLLLLLVGSLVALATAGEQAPTPTSRSPAESAPAGPTPAQRDEDFKKLVVNVTLSGYFTLDGAKETKLEREEYVITGAMKLGNGDYWALTSRIKYGDVDLTVPVPVQVKWAGNTPVITVDGVKIPRLGTFSARVLLDGARYAGTWSHDETGGHLFGEIQRDGAEAK